MMIDTHCHLFDAAFNDDYLDVINKIKNTNICKCILVGFSYDTNRQALLLAKNERLFYPTVGLHPSEANKDQDYLLNDLEYLINNNKIYAIGECGLDYYWVKDNKEKQRFLFESQIKLAIKYDLPIIIHSRDSIEDTYNILKKYNGKVRGVMHCYSGSIEMALRFIELGFYISLGGVVTYKNAVKAKEVARLIPLERLLIETDCPYLAPTPNRGKRNDSSNLIYILEEIAKLRGLDIKELETILDYNSNLLFRLEDNHEKVF